MKFPNLDRSRRLAQRFSHRGPRAGFGAVIGSEIVLLRMLNSVPIDDDIADQREVVAGVIAALRGCLGQLPVPSRFNHLERAARHTDAANGVSPTKVAIMEANADLVRKLCAAHAPASGRQEWETILVHAAAAHREMAGAVRWNRSSQ